MLKAIVVGYAEGWESLNRRPRVGNRDTAAAWEYHNSTKHSLASVRAGSHHLDRSNQPRPYKLYEHLQPIPLPLETALSGVPALAAIAGDEAPPAAERVPDLKTLTTLFQLSSGVTKWLRIPDSRLAFRAAACTGALYHIELYLVCGALPDLEAGVYQFGVHDMALRQLRHGDYRSLLVQSNRTCYAAGAGSEWSPLAHGNCMKRPDSLVGIGAR